MQVACSNCHVCHGANPHQEHVRTQSTFCNQPATYVLVVFPCFFFGDTCAYLRTFSHACLCVRTREKMNKILNIVTVGEFIAQIVTDSTRCVLRSPHICTMRNGYAPESIKIPLFMAYPYHMPYHRALGLAMDWAYICRVYFVIWSIIMCGTLLVLLFIRERVSCVSEARVWSDRYIQASCVCVCVCVCLCRTRVV